METYEIPKGDYIIEVWDASNWNKDTRERTPVPGAKDINWYKKDPTKDYNKGDFVTKIRVFKNEDKPQIPLHQQSSSEGLSDDKIPF
tara:strand:+ start:215 stop:475 length:261 start_codon:yes stop_codon:yes gene_type:complete